MKARKIKIFNSMFFFWIYSFNAFDEFETTPPCAADWSPVPSKPPEISSPSIFVTVFFRLFVCSLVCFFLFVPPLFLCLFLCLLLCSFLCSLLCLPKHGSARFSCQQALRQNKTKHVKNKRRQRSQFYRGQRRLYPLLAGIWQACKLLGISGT